VHRSVGRQLGDLTSISRCRPFSSSLLTASFRCSKIQCMSLASCPRRQQSMKTRRESRTNLPHHQPYTNVASASGYVVPQRTGFLVDSQQSFSTSGHLTRHSTVHTGVKKFKCPFPTCAKECSRQDNLTQQLEPVWTARRGCGGTISERDLVSAVPLEIVQLRS